MYFVLRTWTEVMLLCSRRSPLAFNHVVDSQAVVGKLVKYRCQTKISIWYPADETDRRAIVLLSGAHTHPTPLYDKVAQESERRYEKAVRAVGIMGATVSKVDRGTLQ